MSHLSSLALWLLASLALAQDADPPAEGVEDAPVEAAASPPEEQEAPATEEAAAPPASAGSAALLQEATEPPPPASALADIDVEDLVRMALENPRVLAAEAQLRDARIAVNQETLTPVQGLSIGTGLVPGDSDGSGPQITGNLWLSVNVMDLMAYPSRVRSAKARATFSAEQAQVTRDGISLEVRQCWETLLYLEESIAIQEESVAALEVQNDIANEQFISRQLEIDQYNRVSAQVFASKQALLAARRDFLMEIRRMEQLIGRRWADVKEAT